MAELIRCDRCRRLVERDRFEGGRHGLVEIRLGHHDDVGGGPQVQTYHLCAECAREVQRTLEADVEERL